jgi:beta-galactosidase
MTKSLFNDEWTVRRKISGFVDLLGGTVPEAVTLPHDAMRELPRSTQGEAIRRTGDVAAAAGVDRV